MRAQQSFARQGLEALVGRDHLFHSVEEAVQALHGGEPAEGASSFGHRSGRACALRAAGWGPGTRAPTLLISPFAKRGLVDHTVMDTTAILKLIETRYGLASPPRRGEPRHDRGVRPAAIGYGVSEVPIGVVTVSDRASAGLYEDKGGPGIEAALAAILATPWRPCAAARCRTSAGKSKRRCANSPTSSVAR